MAQKLNPFSARQFLDADGNPRIGAKLFTYVAGSTTKATVTQDSGGTANHSNPIILNANGEPADVAGSAQAIWQPEGVAIDLVLAPSTDSDPPVAAYSTWADVAGINDSTVITPQDQWSSGPSPTYISATSFSLVGDQTSVFHIGRRIRTSNSGGTIYGTITNSVYTSLTTITVANDSGALDSGLSAVSYGILSATNPSVPADLDKLRSITVSEDVNAEDVRITRTLTDIPPTTAGSATVYTATLGETAYTSDTVYRVQIHATNTGAATLELDSLGAKNIKTLYGSDPEAGELILGMVARFVYDGTNLVLINSAIKTTEQIQDAAITGDKLALAVTGTYISASSDVEVISTATSYTKLKEIYVPYGGTFSVQFDLKTSDPSFNVYGRIYVNGIAVGTQRTKIGVTTYETFTEDITVVPGDLIQLYGYKVSTASCYVQNFRVREDAPLVFVTVT